MNFLFASLSSETMRAISLESKLVCGVTVMAERTVRSAGRRVYHRDRRFVPAKLCGRSAAVFGRDTEFACAGNAAFRASQALDRQDRQSTSRHPSQLRCRLSARYRSAPPRLHSSISRVARAEFFRRATITNAARLKFRPTLRRNSRAVSFPAEKASDPIQSS